MTRTSEEVALSGNSKAKVQDSLFPISYSHSGGSTTIAQLQ